MQKVLQLYWFDLFDQRSAAPTMSPHTFYIKEEETEQQYSERGEEGRGFERRKRATCFCMLLTRCRIQCLLAQSLVPSNSLQWMNYFRLCFTFIGFFIWYFPISKTIGERVWSSHIVITVRRKVSFWGMRSGKVRPGRWRHCEIWKCPTAMWLFRCSVPFVCTHCIPQYSDALGPQWKLSFLLDRPLAFER